MLLIQLIDTMKILFLTDSGVVGHFGCTVYRFQLEIMDMQLVHLYRVYRNSKHMQPNIVKLLSFMKTYSTQRWQMLVLMKKVDQSIN